MTTATEDALSALTDDQAILIAERAELVDYVFQVVTTFAASLEAADDGIRRWLDRAEEVKSRADVAGVPFIVESLPRLNIPPGIAEEALARFRAGGGPFLAGRES
jgi:hypothetical protein